MCEIGEFGLIERSIRTASQVALNERVRWHDQVESAASREHVRFEHLRAVEIGDIDLDAGQFLEGRQCVGGDFIGPHIEVYRGVGGLGESMCPVAPTARQVAGYCNERPQNNQSYLSHVFIPVGACMSRNLVYKSCVLAMLAADPA